MIPKVAQARWGREGWKKKILAVDARVSPVPPTFPAEELLPRATLTVRTDINRRRQLARTVKNGIVTFYHARS